MLYSIVPGPQIGLTLAQLLRVKVVPFRAIVICFQKVTKPYFYCDLVARALPSSRPSWSLGAHSITFGVLPMSFSK